MCMYTCCPNFIIMQYTCLHIINRLQMTVITLIILIILNTRDSNIYFKYAKVIERVILIILNTQQ